MTEAVTVVQGIGPHMAKTLSSEGIRTVENLATATIERLVTIEGIGRIKAEQFVKAARKRLKATGSEDVESGLNGKSTPQREKAAKIAKKKSDKKKSKKKAPKKSKKSKKDKKSKKSKKGSKTKKGKKSKKKGKKK